MSDSTKALSIMVRGAYSFQKLRIQTGLRLCANFRDKLKVEAEAADAPDTDPDGDDEELSEKALKIIDDLKQRYIRLTEGVARNRTLPAREGFVGDGVISEFTELGLIHQYTEIEKLERAQFRMLGEALEEIPIYTGWLHEQKGIGPALAGVLVAWFDITKAERPSQFWAFAGLDVGPDGFARSRRKAHLIEREYTDRSGETKTRLSTTFDPWLQSRLLGVLGSSLLRTGSPYRKYYDDYRHRIESDPARPKGTLLQKKKLIAAERQEEADAIWHPLRIHRASMRYMVKQFIADFWRKWRETEGLPTVPPYHEGVLGHVHHGQAAAE